MSVTISRYLKLRIDSGLTANAKYNLNRIDLLGADVDAINQDASILGFLDIATGGSKRLRFRYRSDITGSTDTVADRILNIDLQGADRSLFLNGDLGTTGTGNLILNLSSNSTVTLPTTGTLATLAGAEALSNKLSLGLSNGSFQASLQASGSQLANYTLTLPVDDGANGQILTTNGSGVLSWASAGSGTGDVEGFVGTWATADGTSKVVTHSLLSDDPDVTVIDSATDEIILVNSIVATNSNSVTLTASEAPSSSWRVVIQAKP